MAQTQQSLTSENEPGSYPQNVASHTLAPYILDTIRQQLISEAPRLFTGEAGAALDFLDLGDGAQGIFNAISSSSSALHSQTRFLADSHQQRQALESALGDPSISQPKQLSMQFSVSTLFYCSSIRM